MVDAPSDRFRPEPLVSRRLVNGGPALVVRQADHGYMLPEPDLSVRLESLTYSELVPPYRS